MSDGGVDGAAASLLVVGADRATDALREAGFDVRSVARADAAIAALEDAPEAVVSAVDLPDTNGESLLRRVRERDFDVPVVLVGPPDGEQAVAVIEADGADYVPERSMADLPDRVAEAIAAADDRRGVRARRDQLAALHDVAAELSTCETIEAACEVAVEAAEDVLEFDICLVDLERDGVLEVIATSEGLDADGFADMPTDEGVSGMTFQRKETFRFDDIQTDERAEPQGEYRAVLSAPIGEYGIFQAGSKETGFFDEGDQQLAELLVAHLEAALTRIQREEKLELLHTVTRRLVREETPADVLEAAVEATEEVLGHGYAAAWLYDPDEDVLRQVTQGSRAAAEYDAAPAFDPGEGILGWAFEQDEEVLLADAQNDERAHDEGTAEIRSYGVFPLGGHGAFVLTSPEADAFDRGETEAARILAANTRVALDRVSRETELRAERNFIQSALDSLDDVFFYTDDGIERWNRRLLEVTDMSAEAIEGADPASLLAGGDRERMEAALEGARDGDRPVVEPDFLTAEGPVPFEFRLTRVVDDSGVRGVVGVGRDVSERIERERELERQTERLEQFASFLSHDLRNPLSVAHGRVELALEDGDEVHLEKALDALSRMDALVDDVLSFARHGRSVVDTEPVPLEEVAVAAWETVSDGEGTLVAEDLPTVTGDSGRIRALLENLFRNALDHAGPEPTVRVEAFDDGFAVADDGPGIEPERREAVFEYGHSGDDGSGFGLAIVDEITAAHGWDVELVESDDGGARFEFHGVRVPIAAGEK